MLTRLKVNGFKNLVDVDVRFGPFTCIAGVNGSGKSNLFDAIRFLAALAEKPLIEAALSIRGVGGSYDIHNLFHRVGDQYAKEMSFEAEMIVPAEGTDDLGQPISAGSTALRYRLSLAYRAPDNGRIGAPLEIKHETLEALGSDDAPDLIRFSPGEEWRESAIRSDSPRVRTLFSVPSPAAMSQNGHPMTPGRWDTLVPALLPRTVLSVATTVADAPADEQSNRVDPQTLARQEMQSWRVLHLDPAEMRHPSYRSDPPTLADTGYGFVRTLYEIARTPPKDGRDPYEAETAVYARVAGAIWDLTGEISEITVEQVNERGELELVVKQRDGTTLSGRAMSDGTLRLLALAVLVELEDAALYCIEEPEHGIHPGRIQALLDRLRDVALDTSYPIEEGNPLRQVIISTHSPSVVMRVPADSLVVAELRDTVRDSKHFNRAHFSGLANTWREPVPSRKSLALGRLLTFLNPEGYRPLPRPDPDRDPDAEPRIMDRSDIRDLLTPLPKLDG